MVFHPPYRLPLLLLLLLGGHLVKSQNSSTDSQNTTTSQNITTFDGPSYNFGSLDSRMKAAIAEWGVRGASIAFFDKNSMAQPYVQGYGRIDSRRNSPLVTADTVFLLASVSKVVTGTVVLKLIDLGILSSVDDDICNVLPSNMTNTTACRNPHYPNVPVTWRMLLTHRSSLKPNIPYFVTNQGDQLEAGYAPTGGYFGLAAGQRSCPMEDVRGFYRDILLEKESETIVGQDLGLNWYALAEDQLGGMWRDQAEPGEEVVYSNFAVGYVAALVEWALIMDETSGGGSGQPPSTTSFANFSQQYIFEPLGMHNTSWFLRDLNLTTTQVAMPVEPINEKETQFQDIGHYCFIDYASGSLLSSAVDVAKFLNSLLDYGVPTLWSNQELGRSSLNCLERSANGEPVRNCEFGASWLLLKPQAGNEEWLEPYQFYDWTDGAEIAGQEAGAQTQILVLPQAGVYAVVLTNTDGNDDYAAQIMAMKMLETIHPSGSAAKTGGWLAIMMWSTLIMSLLWW